jgi:uncharacterized membrane protein YhhN
VILENTPALTWLFITLGFLAGLLIAEYRQAGRLQSILKPLASTGFVGTAIAAGALDSTYGQVLLAAFALSWFGDVFLLSQRSKIFLYGLASFLFAHIAFIFAFILHGQAWLIAAVALGVLVLPTLVVIRWLRPHVAGSMRKPVWLYITAITFMLSLAFGTAGAGGHIFILAGAAAFYLSDISVARDRFINRSFVNRLWGLPFYYVGQLLLAMSAGFSRGG